MSATIFAAGVGLVLGLGQIAFGLVLTTAAIIAGAYLWINADIVDWARQDAQGVPTTATSLRLSFVMFYLAFATSALAVESMSYFLGSLLSRTLGQ